MDSAHVLGSAPQSGDDRVTLSVLSGEERHRLAILLRDHYTFIWRLLRRLGVPVANAEDATQDVFMIAGKRIGTISVGSERSFLFGTALRVASNFRRSPAARREQLMDRLPDTPSDHPPADELLDRSRALRLIDDILEAMDEDLRSAFILFELEGLSTPEIASVCGIPLGTAASRLRRAREEFTRQRNRVHARRSP